MKYRGFDPRTRALRWGAYLLVLVAVLAVTGPGALATMKTWLVQEHDRLPWYGTRLFGMLAYLALTVSVLYGLLLSTGILDALAHRVVSFTLHQDLAAIGISLAMVHGALLTIDATQPLSPFALLVPFQSGYRPVWVGAGQIALYLMAITYFSFYVRRSLGRRGWRLLHYLTFLAFAGATAHGLMSGSDTSAPWAFWMYVAAVAAVLFLFGYRLTLALARVNGGSRPQRTNAVAARGGGPAAVERRPLPPRPVVAGASVGEDPAHPGGSSRSAGGHVNRAPLPPRPVITPRPVLLPTVVPPRPVITPRPELAPTVAPRRPAMAGDAPGEGEQPPRPRAGTSSAGRELPLRPALSPRSALAAFGARSEPFGRFQLAALPDQPSRAAEPQPLAEGDPAA